MRPIRTFASPPPLVVIVKSSVARVLSETFSGTSNHHQARWH
jgi:hypothetical protein